MKAMLLGAGGVIEVEVLEVKVTRSKIRYPGMPDTENKGYVIVDTPKLYLPDPQLMKRYNSTLQRLYAIGDELKEVLGKFQSLYMHLYEESRRLPDPPEEIPEFPDPPPPE